MYSIHDPIGYLDLRCEMTRSQLPKIKYLKTMLISHRETDRFLVGPPGFVPGIRGQPNPKVSVLATFETLFATLPSLPPPFGYRLGCVEKQ